MTLDAATLAAAHAELDAWDAKRFEKHGNMGATRGLARRVKMPRTPAPVARGNRATPAAPLALGPVDLPELHPCPWGCGRLIGNRRASIPCWRCKSARYGPRPCIGGCGTMMQTSGSVCRPCRKRRAAERGALCWCGRPVHSRGECDAHSARSRRQRDHTVAAKERERQRTKCARRSRQRREVTS